MKLLVYGLNHAPELTGIGKYTGEMVAWLAARGHEVRVVTAPPYYPGWRIDPAYRRRLWSAETREGARVYRCPLYVPADPGGLRRIAHHLSFALASLPVAWWQAVAWHPQAIFAVAPSLMAAPGALLAARLGGSRTWLHVQDFEVEAAFELGILAANEKAKALALNLEGRIFRAFDRLSTVSERMRQRLVIKGVLESHAMSFPNWVDTKAIRPLESPSPYRAELSIPPDAIVALYAGNIGEKQGVETLAELGENLPDDGPIRLVIAGEGAAASRLSARLAGRAAVNLLPLQPADRLNDLLNLADIHLLPQRADAADLVMPSKLAAMMASGRPVIAGAAPGTEVGRWAGGAGILVAPGDARAMGAALVALAGDASERLKLGARARALACATWDKEKILGDFERRIVALASRPASEH